jgi:hypothetical protein
VCGRAAVSNQGLQSNVAWNVITVWQKFTITSGLNVGAGVLEFGLDTRAGAGGDVRPRRSLLTSGLPTKMCEIVYAFVASEGTINRRGDIAASSGRSIRW